MVERQDALDSALTMLPATFATQVPVPVTPPELGQALDRLTAIEASVGHLWEEWHGPAPVGSNGHPVGD